jgi:hypothetical protein
MSFEQFRYVTTLHSKETWYFELVDEWQAKRDALQVQLSDLPTLVAQTKAASREPHPTDARITIQDRVPSVRLANACEAMANSLYGMAEIAAFFGNRASGTLPSSFNDLRKKARAGELDPELITSLGDLQWYAKVRELRTEWSHYSSVFVGEEGDREPVLLVRALRRPVDKEQFPKPTHFRVSEIVAWTESAIRTIDGFADYLLLRYVCPKFDPDQEILQPKRDALGFPILLPDLRMDVETITIREFFARKGIVQVPPAEAPAAEPEPPPAS